MFPVYQILDGLQDHQILIDVICSPYGEAGSWETLLLEVSENLYVSERTKHSIKRFFIIIRNMDG